MFAKLKNLPQNLAGVVADRVSAVIAVAGEAMPPGIW
jgi:hypothetical protein